MIRLYNKSKKAYWEAWIDNNSNTIIHYGILGDIGKVLEIKGDSVKQDLETKSLISKRIEDGYTFIEDNDLYQIIIEYEVKNYNDKILIKSIKLEEYLNEKLGWIGLGYCDGNSVGSGTMEIFCYVIDRELACNFLKDNLGKNKDFYDYKKIY